MDTLRKSVKQFDRLQTKYTDLKAKYKAVKHFDVNDLDLLEAENVDLKRSLSAAEHANETLELEMDSLRFDYHDTKTTLEKLTLQHAEAERLRDQYENERDELRWEVDGLRSEVHLKEKAESDRDEWEEAYAELSKERQDLQSKLDDLRREKEEWLLERTRLRQKKNRFKKENDLLRGLE